MPSTHPVALVVFDGIQILDVSGPAAVFAAANDAAGHPYYRVHILSARGGEVRSNCAMSIMTAPLASLAPELVDILLFSGGDDAAVLQAADDDTVRAWVLKAGAGCRRLGSICSGALALARLGLLDGKRATTHWSACADLAADHPQVRVDANAVYVADGRVWTSAGVTTGIDMSLQMVARDLGESIANLIAKRLVVYARRPGYQAQVSAVVAAQEKADPDFAALIGWIKANLARPLDVAALAEKVAMTPRTFHRKFTDSLGQTPARFVESLRLDQGRDLLASGLAVKFIAGQCGYANAAQFSKAFQRRYGLPAQEFQQAAASPR
jgi:transcriptional regulator GlxA family with amidase domain